MNIHKNLSKKIQQAMILAGASNKCEAQVKQSAKARFGDYQANGIMAAAKQLCIPPHTLAKKVVELLDLGDIAYKVDIAGPGFINIFLNRCWLEKQLNKIFSSPRLGIDVVVPQNIVIDYSAPNIAKSMHVGHMRSTIIGDVSARILTFLGHNVIRANHIGDWGTQFGMLIAYLEKTQNYNKIEFKISNLEQLYQAAKRNYDNDPDFAKLARSYVVKLQNGDSYCRSIWRKIVDFTIEQNQKIYDRLKVTLKRENIMGESLYNAMLPEIVADLKNKGLAVESAGAVVVFLENFKNKQGQPMGEIIQKKDGAYLYTTTDIACAKYRYEHFKADRIIYYIDSRQQQHLTQVWDIVRMAGYVPKSVLLEHHMLGMILGNDGKPFKTRTGKAVKLNDLLDEALNRARNLIISKNPSINKDKLEKLAQVISIGAIKYADLSKHRTKNYIFDLDNMLNFEGNTALYMQYAYARIISIFKRSNSNNQLLEDDIILSTTQEIQLAIRLLQLEEIVVSTANNGTPHILCSYLYNLTVLFSNFYEMYPILFVKNEYLRQSRLKLALLVARTLKQGLNLLGIETIDRI